MNSWHAMTLHCAFSQLALSSSSMLPNRTEQNNILSKVVRGSLPEPLPSGQVSAAIRCEQREEEGEEGRKEEEAEWRGARRHSDLNWLSMLTLHAYTTSSCFSCTFSTPQPHKRDRGDYAVIRGC